MVGPQSEFARSPQKWLPKTPVRRLTEPLARFLEYESASGIVLLACTAVALGVANSPAAHGWESFWHTKLSVSLGAWELSASLAHWVNDGLMTIFFFLVGLEIKREVVYGELRTPQKTALPILAAFGGMIAPAAIYLALRYGDEGERGWGIPMATDIAFAIGVLTLLGKRVPIGLKIFLLALAIADDIGAILVIALFYSGNLSVLALALAVAGVVLIYLMARLGVRSITAYALAGVGIWLAMFNSGIHPTIAGVLLGLMTPSIAWMDRLSLSEVLLDALDRLDGEVERTHAVGHPPLPASLAEVARESMSPLERLESSLHPWVAFVIMPIFALANAGVALEPGSANHGVAWAVAAGLVIGKPLGIVVFSWVAVQLRLAQLPEGVTWKAILGAGCLGGIGFTMSLFIANLGLENKLLDAAKIGTLGGSVASAAAGLVLLLFFLPRSGNQAED